jgi:hypothetical protein
MPDHDVRGMWPGTGPGTLSWSCKARAESEDGPTTNGGTGRSDGEVLALHRQGYATTNEAKLILPVANATGAVLAYYSVWCDASN